MRLPARRAIAATVGLGVLGLAACDKADQHTTLVEPQLAARSPACDFGRMANDARRYFPGNGPGSPSRAVQDLIDLMSADCSAGDAASYTAHWFEIAAILGDVLSAGTGGDASDGASFLATSLTVAGADGETPIFDPCGDDDECVAWEGYPALPDFEAVLSSPHGAWAVVSTGTSAVCSSFEPCSGWSAALQGDAWGVEPSVSWQAALAGRTTVVFGHPLPGPSPTGETLLDTELPAYQWLLIPDPGTFGVDQTPPAVLEVGLCSTAVPTRIEAMVQKGSTVLTEAIIDWCDDQIPSIARRGTSIWDRALAFLSPAPAPLVATTAMAALGPGGSASSFTDFYAIDVPSAAVLALSAEPADGFVGQPIVGADGMPFAVLTHTSSEQSPLENALVALTVIGNGGLIASGGSVSGTGLTCDGFSCTGTTQADHEPSPGTLELPLVFTKPGQYSLCFEASLPPLSFGAAVCTEKFNVRP